MGRLIVIRTYLVVAERVANMLMYWAKLSFCIALSLTCEKLDELKKSLFWALKSCFLSSLSYIFNEFGLNYNNHIKHKGLTMT